MPRTEGYFQCVHKTLEVVDTDNEYKHHVKKYASFHRKRMSHWLNQNIAEGSEKKVLLSHLLQCGKQ